MGFRGGSLHGVNVPQNEMEREGQRQGFDALHGPFLCGPRLAKMGFSAPLQCSLCLSLLSTEKNNFSWLQSGRLAVLFMVLKLLLLVFSILLQAYEDCLCTRVPASVPTFWLLANVLILFSLSLLLNDYEVKPVPAVLHVIS